MIHIIDVRAPKEWRRRPAWRPRPVWAALLCSLSGARVQSLGFLQLVPKCGHDRTLHVLPSGFSSFSAWSTSAIRSR